MELEELEDMKNANEKTRQNSVNKQTFDLLWKNEIEEKNLSKRWK